MPIEVTNSSDKVEPQPEPPSTITIAFGQNLETLDEPNGMFIDDALA